MVSTKMEATKYRSTYKLQVLCIVYATRPIKHSKNMSSPVKKTIQYDRSKWNEVISMILNHIGTSLGMNPEFFKK